MHRGGVGVLRIQVAAVTEAGARQVVSGGVGVCHMCGEARLAGVTAGPGVRMDRAGPWRFVVRQIAVFIPLSECRRLWCGRTRGRLQGAARPAECPGGSVNSVADQPSCQ
ncbi:hypothetical protein GCM10009663_27040 [Kitasatospora arboriphila]|uniref:Transposase IS204/IS1001/IS1096/IS1165 zinc-finger domain-containing protein n=1 Tax=Kitasatospora arboriphila TaxID=258052 RepID=A0ABP4DZQ9_9ACTN